MEYEETLNKARSKFCVHERRYGEEKYWNDPDYLFDWTDGSLCRENIMLLTFDGNCH